MSMTRIVGVDPREREMKGLYIYIYMRVHIDTEGNGYTYSMQSAAADARVILYTASCFVSTARSSRAQTTCIFQKCSMASSRHVYV